MSITILRGDVREVLATLEPESFDCVVTSPPYWGLRDYGIVGQIGLERTLGEHLSVLIEVFAAVRRVMKPQATLWLNYGDCYATSPNGRSAADIKAVGNDDRTFRDKPFSTIGPIYDPTPNGAGGSFEGERRGFSADRGRIRAAGQLKPKDLCMVANRLAIALQDDGWWVRSEIIWHKPNPMPESITDRPTSSHEKIWLMTKSQRYFFDADAVREDAEDRSLSSWNDRKQTDSIRRGDPGLSGHVTTTDTLASRPGRNIRNVWTIATSPFPEAHFATFPPELAERCIKAGCPVGGCVLDPFGGAGTVGLVADRLGRDATLIELNPAYVEIAMRRIKGDAPLFAEVAS